MPQQMGVVAIRVALLASSVILAFVLAEGVLHLLVPPSRGDLFMYTAQSMRYKVMKPESTLSRYRMPKPVEPSLK